MFVAGILIALSMYFMSSDISILFVSFLYYLVCTPTPILEMGKIYSKLNLLGGIFVEENYFYAPPFRIFTVALLSRMELFSLTSLKL